MRFKCDKCGQEFNADDFPEEGFKCPKCGAQDSTFSLVE